MHKPDSRIALYHHRNNSTAIRLLLQALLQACIWYLHQILPIWKYSIKLIIQLKFQMKSIRVGIKKIKITLSRSYKGFFFQSSRHYLKPATCNFRN